MKFGLVLLLFDMQTTPCVLVYITCNINN